MITKHTTRRALRCALGLAALAAASQALAHPGHGAPLWHSHGELALAIAAMAGVAGGTALHLAGREQASARLQRWGGRLATSGLLATALLLASRF
ncbi:MAG: hypothetical protein CFE45_44180 [Burkholderiales bacterium PBB5]|nr:MAG: hypothetical protein CFE45_44180 [Burkholderiales bacterium PBB5]